MLEEAVELFAKRAHDKQLELILDYEPRMQLAVRGDALRLRQVLMNLIANAIKFTARGLVIVRVRAAGSDPAAPRVLFEVQDSGIGIRAENLGMVFDSFSQEDGSVTRRFGGTGLGLAISRQLTELMGGKIAVRSEFGRGSCFSIEMPFKQALSEPGSSRGEALLHVGRSILVVDDNPVNREILENQLSSIGFSVVAADRGSLGLQLLERRRSEQNDFDLMVLDGLMPDMNGIDVLRKLRTMAGFERLPVVLLSSLSTDVDVEDAAELQPLARLNKPVRQSALRTIIARLISGDADIQARPVRPQTAGAGAMAGMRVLLVEDNLVNRELASEMLRRLGCNFDTAENGAIALEKLAADRYDTVLMDCQMPVLDGFEATTRLRQREKEQALNHTWVLALTANALQGDRELCLTAGMDDYLSKPFSGDQLQAALQRGRDFVQRRAKANASRATTEKTASDRADQAADGIDDSDLNSGGTMSFNGPLVDASVLETIAALDPGGSSGLVQRIVNLYQEDSVKQLQELRSALSSGDLDVARRAVHSLKSASANVGVHALSKVCGDAEAAARAGNLGAVAEFEPQLVALHAAVLQELAAMKFGAAA